MKNLPRLSHLSAYVKWLSIYVSVKFFFFLKQHILEKGLRKKCIKPLLQKEEQKETNENRELAKLLLKTKSKAKTNS